MGAWERGSEGRDYVFIWLIHFIVQLKLTQYCKAIIFQQKNNSRKRCQEKFDFLEAWSEVHLAF